MKLPGSLRRAGETRAASRSSSPTSLPRSRSSSASRPRDRLRALARWLGDDGGRRAPSTPRRSTRGCTSAGASCGPSWTGAGTTSTARGPSSTTWRNDPRRDERRRGRASRGARSAARRARDGCPRGATTPGARRPRRRRAAGRARLRGHRARSRRGRAAGQPAGAAARAEADARGLPPRRPSGGYDEAARVLAAVVRDQPANGRGVDAARRRRCSRAGGPGRRRVAFEQALAAAGWRWRTWSMQLGYARLRSAGEPARAERRPAAPAGHAGAGARAAGAGGSGARPLLDDAGARRTRRRRAEPAAGGVARRGRGADARRATTPGGLARLDEAQARARGSGIDAVLQPGSAARRMRSPGSGRTREAEAAYRREVAAISGQPRGPRRSSPPCCSRKGAGTRAGPRSRRWSPPIPTRGRGRSRP